MSFRISGDIKRDYYRRVLKTIFLPEKLTKSNLKSNGYDNQFDSDYHLHNVTIIHIKNIERYKYLILYKVVPDRHIPL